MWHARRVARLVAVKCPNCGANLRVDPEWAFVTCDYCRASSFVQTKQRRVSDPTQQQLVVDVPDRSQRVLLVTIAGAVWVAIIGVVSVVAFQQIRNSSSRTVAPVQPPAELVRTQTTLERAPSPTSEPSASVATAPEAAEPGESPRPKARPGPTESSRVSAGSLTVSGRLPPKVVGDVVRGNFGRFRMCHEQAMASTPGLTGTVRARFVIGRDGNVANVGDGGSDVTDAGLKRCVLSAFSGLSFPKPEAGIVTVVYPVILRTQPAKSR
jgi:hypothetical protein